MAGVGRPDDPVGRDHLVCVRIESYFVILLPYLILCCGNLSASLAIVPP